MYTLPNHQMAQLYSLIPLQWHHCKLEYQDQSDKLQCQPFSATLIGAILNIPTSRYRRWLGSCQEGLWHQLVRSGWISPQWTPGSLRGERVKTEGQVVATVIELGAGGAQTLWKLCSDKRVLLAATVPSNGGSGGRVSNPTFINELLP